MKKRGVSKGSLIIVSILIIFFLFGWYSNTYYNKVSIRLQEMPYGISEGEKNSPKDWIRDKQIMVYNNMVVLNISNVEWASYTDTNSMDPVLDETTNGLEIKPEKEEDITKGDIIVYKPGWADGLLVHRVLDVDKDEQGTYYTVKGDNSEIADPEKVRFNQVTGVVIGVLY